MITGDAVVKALFMGGVALGVGRLYISTRSRGPAKIDVELYSMFANSTAEFPDLLPEIQRSQFSNTPLIHRRPVKNHSHGSSAASRSSASLFCDRFASSIGLVPYFVQCSRSDQRIGRLGSRSIYWGKDLIASVCEYAPPKHSMITMIDVDYYVDMPGMLAEEFRPTVLYTFNPTAAASNDESNDYSYTFNKKNELIYNVSGGGRYKHKIWDYNIDNVVVKKKFLGIPYLVAVYAVDRRNVSSDHDLVCLTPLRRWRGIFALVGNLLEGNELKRIEPVEGDFIRMKIQREDGLYTSTGMVGRYASTTIRSEHDDAIRVTAETSKLKLSQATVLSYIEGDTTKDRKAEAAALVKYFRETTPSVRLSEAHICPVSEAVRSYDYGVDSYDPEAKETLTAFMSPIINGAFAPLATLANEEKCIKGRITDFARPKGSLVMTEFLDKAMREFCELLLPEAYAMEPVSIDEVYERQGRPSQRAILDRSLVEDPQRIVKMFIKKEAYGAPKEPRPISTINGADKREYSRFIYTIADHIKTMDWYAFGKTPADIAKRVTEVLRAASSAVNTDFSRFDGRMTEILRSLERMVLIRAFRREYTGEVSELHASQFNQPAVGRFGTRYNTGYARGSGSPETAAFNSLVNAFVAYLTFRMTRENGGFITPTEAWNRLGLYGGDDGLTANVHPDKYMKASDMVGLKLDVELIERGREGITFLARMYGPHVWYGDTNSCCDLPRQLSKLHTTVSLPPNVTPIEKLLEKARAFYLTDANTPVLGPLVSKIVSLHGEILMTTKTKLMRAWNSDLDVEVQYPNVEAEWMQDYAARALGDLGFDFELFERWLGTTKQLKSFLEMPLFMLTQPPALKDGMIINGLYEEPSAVKKQGTSVGVTKSKQKTSKNKLSRSKSRKPANNGQKHLQKTRSKERKSLRRRSTGRAARSRTATSPTSD